MDNADFFKTILDNLCEGAYFVEPDRKIAYWNKTAETITGFAASDVVGRHCWDNILRHVNDAGDRLCFLMCPLAQTMHDGKAREAEVYLHHKHGYRLPVQIRCSPVRDREGLIIGGMEVFADNSPKKAIDARNKELERMALKDTLTELGNRRSLAKVIEAQLSALQRYRAPFGLLFIDIDRFKHINDRFGHGFGDKMLKMVASTLKYNVRASDTLGRWGGEEFVLVAPNIRRKQLIAMAEKLRNLVKTSGLRRADGSMVKVTISVGAGMARSGETEAALVGRADQLMYLSKSHGRDRVSTDLDAAA